MIKIEEIPVENIKDFWSIHYEYLIRDEIIAEEEDKAYFQSSQYRDTIRTHMVRKKDRHHMVYFLEDGKRIGAAQYCTFQSEDGKCFILDYWVFPPYRGGGTGHRYFQALEQYTKQDGALFFELNCERENAARFWKSNEFSENGTDEYGMKLWIKK